jgi:hypothetical protein
LSVNTVDNIDDSEVHSYVKIHILHVVIFLKNEAHATSVGEIYTVNIISLTIKCVVFHYWDGLE